jgi:circadian clock protein KaiB
MATRKVKKASTKPSENQADERKKATGPKKKTWDLRLYIAGQTPRSKAAYENLKALCERHIPGQYSIQLIDLVKDPKLARVDQILAIPTLVRKLPMPIRQIIGDLSDSERAMVALDFERRVG